MAWRRKTTLPLARAVLTARQPRAAHLLPVIARKHLIAVCAAYIYAFAQHAPHGYHRRAAAYIAAYMPSAALSLADSPLGAQRKRVSALYA